MSTSKIVINKLIQILSYQRQGVRNPKRKKEEAKAAKAPVPGSYNPYLAAKHAGQSASSSSSSSSHAAPSSSSSATAASAPVDDPTVADME